jgi:double-stranded uracil-DNA glycosylase
MLSDSFPPVTGADARVLILGSLPGPLSLARQQYYAMPQNAFWRIMGRLVGAAPELPYGERLERLMARRIALWDVCATAFRQGALDTAIQPDSVVPNDIGGLLRLHPAMALICFNGAKSAAIFARRILPALPPGQPAIGRAVLPSTSPAFAGMPFDEKLRRWGDALRRGGVLTD